MSTFVNQQDNIAEVLVKMVKPVVLYGIGALIVLILLFGSYFTIPAGYCGVLTTFGAASQNVLAPGLHFKLPVVQSAVKMNVQVQKNQVTEHAASLDLQDVETTVATNWNINDSDASWI